MDDGARRVTRAAGRIAVIGGGWAGLAAAVTLAQSGRSVTVFEQARTLGGRARRVVRGGLALDNGQHVLAGSCRQTLALLATVHGAEHTATLFRRLPLTIAPFGTETRGRVRLRVSRVAAPLHLAAALATARGLSWPERLALAASYRRIARARFECPPAQTVAECFASAPRRVFDTIWAPLAVAALNTPPERASARMFAAVVGETLAGPASASDLLVPACDLSALFPEAAARFVAARGGEVRIGVGVRGLQVDAEGVVVRTIGGEQRFVAAVIAVGPHQLQSLAAEFAVASDSEWRDALAHVAAFRYEAITTIYVAYPTPVPFPAPIARLDDAPGQWAFERSALLDGTSDEGGSLVAVVMSASSARDGVGLPERIDGQLRRLVPGLPVPRWSHVIAEQRATYACTPALPRPRPGRIAPRLYLCGDYTAERLPPTLEAAIRSGVAAARALVSEPVLV